MYMNSNVPITEKLKNNKMNIFFGLTTIVYIILAVFISTKNPYNIMKKYNALSIVFFLFGSFILLMSYFFMKKRTEFYTESDISSPSLISYIGNIIGSIFVLCLIGLMVYGVIYLFKNAPFTSSIILYLLNALIFIGILTMMYIFLNPFFKNAKNPFIKLIFDVIVYIPCLVLSFMNFFIEQYNITTKPIWILFGIEIFLISLSFLLPKLFDKIVKHDGVELLKKPTSLREEKSIGNFEILNKRNNKYEYNYAISLWIYLEAQPPSTDVSYAEKTTLLSYGGKPNIYYDGNTNEIIITAKVGHEDKIVYKTNKFNYQKWMNIIINYAGGTLDIFIDNKLITSVKNIVPYMSRDNIVIGKKNGTYGFISDVTYFNKTISKDKINWIYKTTKI